VSKILVSSGNITRARFVKVYASANNQCAQAGDNERTLGISQIGGREAPIPSVTQDPPYAAIAGENVKVHTMNSEREDVVLEIGSGGCTAGDQLKSDTNGKGVVSASTGTTVQWIGAIALETASAGELCKVALVNYAYRPALV
jgi:hypothetical protein